MRAGDIVAAALSLGAVAALAMQTGWLARRPGHETYFAQVRSSAQGVAASHGEWFGSDSAVNPADVSKLRPSVMIGRRYEHAATGQRAEVLLVHCADARDMAYHYPPICYGGSGYEMVWQELRRMRVGGGELDCTEYRFRRQLRGRRTDVVVLNTMLLPGGVAARSMDDLVRAASDPGRHGLGAGQLWIVVDAAITPPRREEVFAEMLELYRDPVALMLRGPAE